MLSKRWFVRIVVEVEAQRLGVGGEWMMMMVVVVVRYDGTRPMLLCAVDLKSNGCDGDL